MLELTEKVSVENKNKKYKFKGGFIIPLFPPSNKSNIAREINRATSSASPQPSIGTFKVRIRVV